MNNVSISDIIAGTPGWVFILFFYLVWRSARALQPRVLPPGKVWLVPGLFIAWGVIGLFERPGEFSGVIARWLVGLVLGGCLGLAVRTPVRVDCENDLIWLPGSVLPLVRVLIIFGAHYVLNVAAVIHRPMHDTYMNWDIYVSGASAGYFIGWGIRFVQACREAPRADLSAWRPAVQR